MGMDGSEAAYGESRQFSPRHKLKTGFRMALCNRPNGWHGAEQITQSTRKNH
jgi:hypothetical protein